MRNRRLTAPILAFVLLPAFLAGCGSDDEGDSGSEASSTADTPSVSDTTPTVKPPPTETKPGAPAPAPAPAPDEGITDKPGGSKSNNVAVPNLVGGDLGSAQSQLDDAGLVFSAQAFNGDRAAIRNSWEVCQTIPKAGKKIPHDTPVTVIGAPAGSCG